MGVLDPVGRNASEMEELKDKYSDMLELTLGNLDAYGGAILNDRYDLMEDEDPFFFLLWQDEDDEVMDISSVEELQRHRQKVETLKQDVVVETIRTRYADALAEEVDIEPDYDNPIESYDELDSLHSRIENLSQVVNDEVAEKTGLDRTMLKRDVDRVDYMLMEVFYTLSDGIDALPLIEGVVESQENIEHEKENLLSRAVDEHREHRESVNEEYSRVGMPKEPVDWDDIIEEEHIRDFMDISDIPTVTYGDTLHMMMEQLCETVEGVEPEYPLHFTNKGGRNDVMKHNRIDNTVRPDAVDDLFVYDFKHMPAYQRQAMEQNGDLERDEKFVEDVGQVNGYLNDLDLPAGMLVYVSSDMEVKEYVVERHTGFERAHLEDSVHEREDYDFDNLFQG